MYRHELAQPAFRAFEKTHLKLPEQRFLTHADNAGLPYANIGRRSVVLGHFEQVS
ncbi:hypothetical protein ACXX9E_27995 [Pseudomonas sp. GNP014]